MLLVLLTPFCSLVFCSLYSSHFSFFVSHRRQFSHLHLCFPHSFLLPSLPPPLRCHLSATLLSSVLSLLSHSIRTSDITFCSAPVFHPHRTPSNSPTSPTLLFPTRNFSHHRSSDDGASPSPADWPDRHISRRSTIHGMQARSTVRRCDTILDPGKNSSEDIVIGSRDQGRKHLILKIEPTRRYRLLPIRSSKSSFLVIMTAELQTDSVIAWEINFPHAYSNGVCH